MSDPYTKWYKAFQAWNRAQNPQFKEYWWNVMKHFQKEFQ